MDRMSPGLAKAHIEKAFGYGRPGYDIAGFETVAGLAAYHVQGGNNPVRAFFRSERRTAPDRHERRDGNAAGDARPEHFGSYEALAFKIALHAGDGGLGSFANILRIK